MGTMMDVDTTKMADPETTMMEDPETTMKMDTTMMESPETTESGCDSLTAESLAGRTYSATAVSEQNGREYRYTIVTGESGSLTQERTSDGNTYTLGVHDSYDGMTESFRNGDSCGWSGPRKATVVYSFGPSTEILSVTEPGRCVYVVAVQIDRSECPSVETTKIVYDTTKMEYPETTKMEYDTTKMEYDTTKMDYETTEDVYPTAPVCTLLYQIFSYLLFCLFLVDAA